MKLLVVEDERRMLELLHRGLTEEGHRVECACDGNEGLQKVRNDQFDIVILDIMMPKLNGYDLARRMRKESIFTPVLMLTARDAVSDVVHGLDVGADDYVTKPFSFHELLLRLEAVHRRAEGCMGKTYQVGALVMECSTRKVFHDGKSIPLTRTEYSLLERLMQNAGRVVSRKSLLESVWGDGKRITDNTLDAFVRLLRLKLETKDSQKLIHTVRSVGYIIREETSA